MTCKRVNLSFTLFMTLKDNVRGGKMGVLRLNVPHMLAHGTCGITYLVYTPSCLHQTLVSHLVSHSNCCTNAWTCTEYCRMGDTHLPEGYQMRLVVKSLPKSWQSMSIWGLVMWCTFCRSPFYSHKWRVIAHCVSLPLNMLAGVDSQSLLFPQDFQVSFFLYVLLMLSRYLIGFSRWLPQFVPHNFDARYAFLYGQDWWVFVNLKSCLFLFCSCDTFTQVSFEGLIDLSGAFKLGSNSSRGLPLGHWRCWQELFTDFDFDLTEPQDMEDQKKANSISLCRET